MQRAAMLDTKQGQKVPQVFVNGKYIGSLEELRRWGPESRLSFFTL